MRHALCCTALILAFACAATAQAPLSLLGVGGDARRDTAGSPLRLVIDPKVEKDLHLTKLRTTAGPFEPPDEEDRNPREPAARGLDAVPASGSSQFSRQGLERIRAALPGRKIVIVDLREESHGFLDGLPVSWLGEDNAGNRGLSHREVERVEQTLLKALKREKTARVIRLAKKGEDRTLDLVVDEVQSEKKLCEKAGLAYVRIPVTDHERPSDEDVDRFLKLVRKARGAHLHFHCKAGKGRTTTFMTMLDTLENARALSAEEIAYRQHRLGGSNLLEGVPDEGEEATAAARAAFLRRFHEYARANRAGFETSWSEWLEERREPLYP